MSLHRAYAARFGITAAQLEAEPSANHQAIQTPDFGRPPWANRRAGGSATALHVGIQRESAEAQGAWPA